MPRDGAIIFGDLIGKLDDAARLPATVLWLILFFVRAQRP
jgi:hypothetical protein